MNKKRLPKKNKRRPRGKNVLKNGNLRANPLNLQMLSSVRSNPSDQFITLTLPFKQSKISLSASSTFTYSLEVNDPADILDSTTLGDTYSMFQSWRILHTAINLIPLSSTAGSSTFFFTDAAASTPISSYFGSYRRKTFPNTNARGLNYWMNWRPADFASLDFTPTASNAAQPLICFYGFTNLADFGTPSSTTDLWLITGTVTIQFRGLGL